MSIETRKSGVYRDIKSHGLSVRRNKDYQRIHDKNKLEKDVRALQNETVELRQTVGECFQMLHEIRDLIYKSQSA